MSVLEKLKSKTNNIDVEQLKKRLIKELKLTTIAEGVETKEQRDYLLEKGCDIIQGYYYAKPMPEEEFKEYMEKE